MGVGEREHLAPKHVNPKSRCSLSHVRALTDNANQTPLRFCALFSNVHVRTYGGMVPQVRMSQARASLEVRPRRSGGPLGREKPFPPWSVVMVVRGRMLSAERNS